MSVYIPDSGIPGMRSEPETDVVKQSGFEFLRMFDEKIIQWMIFEEFRRQRLLLLQIHQVSGAARWFGATFATKGCKMFATLQK